MAELFKLIRVLTVLGALAAGGMALWNRREALKQTWDSFGGAEGIVDKANKLVESAGPVRDFVNQMSHLK